MMGIQAGPERLSCDFFLEDHVPDDHLLRRIYAHLDLSDIRQELKLYYSWIGGPPVEPRADDPDVDLGLLLRHPF